MAAFIPDVKSELINVSADQHITQVLFNYQMINIIILGSLAFSSLARAKKKIEDSSREAEDFAYRVGKFWHDPKIPVDHNVKIWSPKNPEIGFTVKKERDLTNSEWKKASFPYRSLPAGISNHVETKKWRSRLNELQTGKLLMAQVLDNLENGCDARVQPPDDAHHYKE